MRSARQPRAASPGATTSGAVASPAFPRLAPSVAQVPAAQDDGRDDRPAPPELQWRAGRLPRLWDLGRPTPCAAHLTRLTAPVGIRLAALAVNLRPLTSSLRPIAAGLLAFLLILPVVAVAQQSLLLLAARLLGDLTTL